MTLLYLSNQILMKIDEYEFELYENINFYQKSNISSFLCPDFYSNKIFILKKVIQK